ncbi:MAG TPA: hypothetical protein VGU20_24950 [Stellaceae bacterium]|nr:hypothetical protein [Stellaceae bacterium]
MKPPARPTSPAPRPASPAAKPAQPMRPTQAAPRAAAARPAPRDHKKLVIIGAVVAVALAVVGYGLSRPSTPWVFDSPEAKKSYVH